MAIMFQIYSNYEDNEEYPTLEYTLSSLQSIKSYGSREWLWSKYHSESCDPEVISSVEVSNDVYLQEEVRIFTWLR